MARRIVIAVIVAILLTLAYLEWAASAELDTFAKQVTHTVHKK